MELLRRMDMALIGTLLASLAVIAFLSGIFIWIHTSQMSRRMRLLLEQAEQQTEYLRAMALRSSEGREKTDIAPSYRPKGPLGLS